MICGVYMYMHTYYICIYNLYVYIIYDECKYIYTHPSSP